MLFLSISIFKLTKETGGIFMSVAELEIIIEETILVTEVMDMMIALSYTIRYSKFL